MTLGELFRLCVGLPRDNRPKDVRKAVQPLELLAERATLGSEVGDRDLFGPPLRPPSPENRCWWAMTDLNCQPTD